MPKFKRIVVIEAEQFWPSDPPFPKGVDSLWGGPDDWECPYKCGDYNADEHGILGNPIDDKVCPGDWIITDTNGKHVCKPDLFKLNYEPVNESTDIDPVVLEDNNFENKLRDLVNHHSRENGSDTPDFILAQYLQSCLNSFDAAVSRREEWYGRKVGSWQDGGGLGGSVRTPKEDD